MKYIQCARNENEQNMVVFQFGADIYFQTYKKIEIGEELLVWYAEYYEQYYGIPVGVRNLAKTKGCSETGQQNVFCCNVIELLESSVLWIVQSLSHEQLWLITKYQKQGEAWHCTTTE